MFSPNKSNAFLGLIILGFTCLPSMAVAQHGSFVAVRATQYTQCGPNGCRPYYQQPMMIRPPVVVRPQMQVPRAVPPELRQKPGLGHLVCNGVGIQSGVGRSGQPGSWVLTVGHLFHVARDPEVRVESIWHDAELIGTDYNRDLALLWVPGVNIPALSIAQADPQPGSAVRLHVYDHLSDGRWLELDGLLSMPPISTTGISRWQWDRGVRQGWSGGAYTSNGELIGIQSAGDSQIGIIVQRESIIKFLTAQSVKLESPAPALINPPAGNEVLEEIRTTQKHIRDSLEAQREDIARIRDRDRKSGDGPRMVISDPSEAQVQSTKPVGEHVPPVETIDPPTQTDQPPGGSLLKDIESGIRYISSGWTWVKLAGYIGGPLGLAIGAAGFLARRRSQRQPKQTTSTAIHLDESERQAYEIRIAELERNKTEINYQSPPRETGLARMREAMRRTSERYPAARTWVKSFEDVYQQLLTGER